MLAGVVLTFLAAAQEGRTRQKPSDYAASAELPKVWLAAEESGHSVLTDAGAYDANDYLVIDVAVFSKEKTAVALAASNFTLRINGKLPVVADSPGAVTASMKYDSWSSRPRLTTGASMGGVGIGTGQPRPQERFPGDPNGQVNLPRAPRVDTNDPNKPTDAPVSLDDLVQRASLPEGQRLVAPFNGFVYFPYSGKLARIKTLELLYEGPYGKTSLKLR
jgi:hypothetical protein